MSELSSYYENFKAGYWANEDPEKCLCHGGWALSEVDTWHECPVHYCGQLHPDYEYTTDEEFDAADRLSRAQWRVKVAKRALEHAQHQVRYNLSLDTKRAAFDAAVKLTMAEADLAAIAPAIVIVVEPPHAPMPSTDEFFEGGDDIPF